MRTHLAIFFVDRSDVAVLKSPVVKSPNLMGWLYWRFAAMTVENRGNGHTWRMPANLIADIGHARYRRFYTPIAAIGENRNRCTGHRSRRSAYKIARCVAGLSQRHTWRFYTPISANLIACDFRWRLMWTHLAIFFADCGDMAVLKTHVIKSPNLMGWLSWRFAAINVENRGNGHTWRMPANLIADI